MWYTCRVKQFVWDVLVCVYCIGLIDGIFLYFYMFFGLDEKLQGYYIYRVIEFKCVGYLMFIK